MSSRVDTVLRIRELQERLAKATVATAQAAQRAADTHETTTWQRLAATNTAIAQHRALDGHALELLGARVAGGRLAGTRAQAASVAAHGETTKALAGWMLASQKRDGVERLAQRVESRHREAQERAEAAQLDELVVQRHRSHA